MKIIIDTNIWIYFLITNRFEPIYKLIKSKRIEIIYSDELFNEIKDVCNRKKFINYFDKDDIKNILNLIKKYGTHIEVSSKLEVFRDKKDNFILNLAVDSSAEFIITGDNDLIILEKIHNTKIISYKEFEFLL